MLAEISHYLSPEPMLQDPEWVRSELQSGFQVPAYAYARNNPIAYTDPTGLYVPPGFPTPGFTPPGTGLPNKGQPGTTKPPYHWNPIPKPRLPPPTPLRTPSPIRVPRPPPVCYDNPGLKPVRCTLAPGTAPNQIPLPGFGCVYNCANGEQVTVENDSLPCEPTFRFTDELLLGRRALEPPAPCRRRAHVYRFEFPPTQAISALEGG